jgi:hypothetical protein
MWMTHSPNVLVDDAARLSAFLGLVRLRKLRAKYPGSSDNELIGAHAVSAASNLAADVITAVALSHELILDTLEEDADSMRRYLRWILSAYEAPWMTTVLRGRSALQQAAPPAVLQCFSYAGLLDDAPDTDALEWWDAQVELLRASSNQHLKVRGRIGERLTLEYERRRLSDLGIEVKPKWTALDDEWAGYDVLSFELDSTGRLKNRLIEVKACSSKPLRIFITRNEWRRALEARDAYVFQIWYLPTQLMVELTWEDIDVNIPVDKGLGTWSEVMVEIELTSEKSAFRSYTTL